MSMASAAVPGWWLLKRSNIAVGRACWLCIVTTAITLATLGKIYWDPLQYVWPIGGVAKPTPIIAQTAPAPVAAPALSAVVLAPLSLSSPTGWAASAVTAPPAPPHHVSHPIAKPLPHIASAPQGPLSWLSGLTAPRAR